MPDYPKDPMPVVAALQSYTPSIPELEAPLAAVVVRSSPVDKLVGAFDALRGHVADLDLEGAQILAGASELIALQNFHNKNVEALGVRDAAIARLESLA